MPMYGTGYIFSKPFFTGWVTVGIIWIFCSFICVGLYPIWESRATLTRVLGGILTGKRPSTVTIVTESEDSGTLTPEKEHMKEGSF
jgi:urea-proton symporter